MAFKNLLGQNKALEILSGTIAHGRVAHAWLFEGEKGIGKYLTARQFAKALNCVSGTTGTLAEPDSCDRCHSCIKIEKQNHPDVLEIQPEDGGQIKVETIRGLEEFFAFKPFEGKYKVVLIDDADRMNPSAANAFLKTLEEPPRQSVIVLVSNRLQALLETIVSRCQRVHFTPLPCDDFKKLFGSQDAEFMSRLTGGRPGLAVDKAFLKERDEALRQFRYLLGSGTESLWETPEAIEAWLEWAVLFFRDMAVLSVSPGGYGQLLVNTDLESELRQIGDRTGLANILELVDELFRLKKLIKFNLNKHLTQLYIQVTLKKKLLRQ
ncbi:MAG TPA: DNA polymerase III subunit delta' [Thermodesulfovibrionia bacterium]|nr:DNA polymerase III subunit delta' [Thermodesulfovibrionia bacterium]